MTPAVPAPSGRWSRLWPLALPLAYAAHLAEEALGGFVDWMRAQGLAPTMDARRFLLLNALFFAVVSIVAVAAFVTRHRRAGLRFLAATLGAVLAMNGGIHLVASLGTATYSPGAATGALLYLPLGYALFARPGVGLAAPEKTAAWVAAAAVHVVVFLLARYGIPGLG